MKKILCYGDSNTYGYIPQGQGDRYAADVRWTGVLAAALGEGYKVLEEGLNGRTTIFDDPLVPLRNGYAELPACLERNGAVDLVIIMLGSNDLKKFFAADARTIAEGAGKLVDLVRQEAGSKMQILLAAPPVTGEMLGVSTFADEFEPDSRARSLEFDREYSRIAAEKNCFYLNTGAYVESSELDSLHLSPESHRILGEAFEKKIREILE